MTIDAPVRDLVIYLQAPEDVLLKRIAKRGIRYERKIDAAYLRRLSEAYTRMFHYYEAAPLLIVNAAHIDLVNSDQDYAALLEQIHVTSSGRQYFNPVSAVILTVFLSVIENRCHDGYPLSPQERVGERGCECGIHMFTGSPHPVLLGNCSMHRLKRLLLVPYPLHPYSRPAGRRGAKIEQ